MAEEKLPNFIFSGFSKYWGQWRWKKRILFIFVFGSMWLLPVFFALSVANFDMWRDFKKGTIPIEGTVMKVWYEKVGGPTTPGSAGPFGRVIYKINENEYEKIFTIKKEDYKLFKNRQDTRGEGWLGVVELTYSPRNINWIVLSTDLPPRRGVIIFAVVWFVGILFMPLIGKIIISLMLLLVPRDKR
jgi:hypothetical protein